MRDAIIAAVTLNIFNKYSDRIVMANIAQTVNVLQAVILTEGSKMLLTPTYHVFDLFKHHQDATLVYSHFEKGCNYVGKHHQVPCLSASASISDDGILTVTIANTSADAVIPLEISIEGLWQTTNVTANTLSGAIEDHNTFDTADKVKQKPLPTDITSRGVSLTVPACSVTSIRLSR